jgi:hypothetical protein
VLSNKILVNPNKEMFEPYMKYNVPLKQCSYNETRKCYQLEYRFEDMWTLKWPIHRGYNKTNGEGVFYVVPANKTEYGDIVPDGALIEVMKEGIFTPGESNACCCQPFWVRLISLKSKVNNRYCLFGY